MRVDRGGDFWDTIFDVISLVASVVDVVKNPTDPVAWVALAADAASVVVPFATGGGAIVKAASKVDDVVDVVKTVDKVDDVVDVAKTVNKIDDVADVANTARKVHGNSLSTPKEAIGYVLRNSDTDEIVKFGETTRGYKRYTNKFYIENNVYMEPIAKGSKFEMHYWQHDQILMYYAKYGHKPPLNKSFW